MNTDGETPPPPGALNWKDSIATNIQFFREQSALLENAYNPSQIASGALMTVIIMNHNMTMVQLSQIRQELINLRKEISDQTGPTR